MVYAHMAKPAATLDITIGGTKRTFGALMATAPLVQRAVASAEIDEKEQQLATAKGDAAAALLTAVS